MGPGALGSPVNLPDPGTGARSAAGRRDGSSGLQPTRELGSKFGNRRFGGLGSKVSETAEVQEKVYKPEQELRHFTSTPGLQRTRPTEHTALATATFEEKKT